MTKLKINLQNKFRWNELPDNDKNEILYQFKKNIDLLKYCQNYSPAIFKKDSNGYWFIINLMTIEL